MNGARMLRNRFAPWLNKLPTKAPVASLVILAVLAVSALSCLVPSNARAGMETLQGKERKMSKKPFGLSENEYWSDPWKNLSEFAWDRIGNNIEGIVIDCPDFVALDFRQTLPMLAYYSGQTADLQYAPFDRVAVIAAMNLEENRLLARGAIARDAPPPSPPTAKPAPGFSGLEYLVDLRQATGMEWRPSIYLVTVVMRDKVSNRQNVRLEYSKMSFEDPEVKKFLEEQRRKLPPRTPSPPVTDRSVRYSLQKDSLPLPEAIGITLAADRIVVGRAGEKGRLRGSFRLPVSPADVARLPAKSASVDALPVTAVAAIALMATGSEISSPVVLPLNVPSHQMVTGTPEAPVAVGYFEIDLLKIPALLANPQTYFIYAFSGEVMAGPVLMAIVGEDSLPVRK